MTDLEKLEHVQAVLEEALELNKKTIIFCNFNDEMDSFIRHFSDKCVCLRGGMTDKQKQKYYKLAKQEQRFRDKK